MGSTRFRNPQALSSTLASLGTLQPRAFGFLNRIDPLVSVSNYYIDSNKRNSGNNSLNLLSFLASHVSINIIGYGGSKV